jgi:ubiquitin C-terminal hydrolase
VNSGHYTGMIRKQDEWWLMNDSYVTRADRGKVWKSNESYMLFFQREL